MRTEGQFSTPLRKMSFQTLICERDVGELHFSPSLQESITAYGQSLRSSEAQLFVL